MSDIRLPFHEVIQMGIRSTEPSWEYQQLQIERFRTMYNGKPKLAIFDTGIDPKNTELSKFVFGKYDYTNEGFDRPNHHAHGTFVASKAVGKYGLLADVELYDYKVMCNNGSGCKGAVWLQAMQYAYDLGIRIINMSFGGDQLSYEAEAKITEFSRKGMIIITAAGNDGNLEDYPGAYKESGGTAAYGQNFDGSLRVPKWSSSGDVWAAAPGEMVAGYAMNNTVDIWNGTSMASPYLAALVAVMKDIKPELMYHEVRQILRETSNDIEPLGADVFSGAGAINPIAVLQHPMLDIEKPIEPPTPPIQKKRCWLLNIFKNISS